MNKFEIKIRQIRLKSEYNYKILAFIAKAKTKTDEELSVMLDVRMRLLKKLGNKLDIASFNALDLNNERAQLVFMELKLKKEHIATMVQIIKNIQNGMEVTTHPIYSLGDNVVQNTLTAFFNAHGPDSSKHIKEYCTFALRHSFRDGQVDPKTNINAFKAYVAMKMPDLGADQLGGLEVFESKSPKVWRFK